MYVTLNSIFQFESSDLLAESINMPASPGYPFLLLKIIRILFQNLPPLDSLYSMAMFVQLIFVGVSIRILCYCEPKK